MLRRAWVAAMKIDTKGYPLLRAREERKQTTCVERKTIRRKREIEQIMRGLLAHGAPEQRRLAP
jgi:hypothetical protein